MFSEYDHSDSWLNNIMYCDSPLVPIGWWWNLTFTGFCIVPRQSIPPKQSCSLGMALRLFLTEYTWQLPLDCLHWHIVCGLQILLYQVQSQIWIVVSSCCLELGTFHNLLLDQRTSVLLWCQFSLWNNVCSWLQESGSICLLFGAFVTTLVTSNVAKAASFNPDCSSQYRYVCWVRIIFSFLTISN